MHKKKKKKKIWKKEEGQTRHRKNSEMKSEDSKYRIHFQVSRSLHRKHLEQTFHSRCEQFAKQGTAKAHALLALRASQSCAHRELIERVFLVRSVNRRFDRQYALSLKVLLWSEVQEGETARAERAQEIHLVEVCPKARWHCWWQGLQCRQ